MVESNDDVKLELLLQRAKKFPFLLPLSDRGKALKVSYHTRARAHTYTHALARWADPGLSVEEAPTFYGGRGGGELEERRRQHTILKNLPKTKKSRTFCFMRAQGTHTHTHTDPMSCIYDSVRGPESSLIT